MNTVYALTENIDLCTGSNYTYPDGTISNNITANETHVSNLTSLLGCDSIVTTNVNIINAFAIAENFDICFGTNYTYPDGTTSTNITANESHVSTFVSVLGCDSVVTTNITVNQVYNLTENVNACENSTVTYPDGTTATITANTSYTSNLTTTAGCDSIIVTNVTMDAVYNLAENVNACENSTVTYPDGTTATITSNTSYTSSLTTMAGCDSIIITNVSMMTAFIEVIDVTICSGDDYTFPDGVTHNSIATNESYSSVFTSINGCDSTVTTNITVSQGPNVVAGNDITVCEGASVTLTASGAQTYVWDNGVTNGVAFNVTSNSVVYTVVGTDINGCTGTDQVTVNMNPAPLVQFVADTLTGCAPLSVTFTNLTVPAGVNCVWTLGNGTTLNGCGDVTTTYNTAGSYSVGLTVTTADGCTGNAYYTDYITVVESPVAIISADTYELDLDDTEVQFYNNSMNADSYEWSFGDGFGSFEEEPSHIYPEAGNVNYDVFMVASNGYGCPDTAYLNIVIKDILIYYVPNVFTPDGDQFNETFQPVFTSGYDPYDYHLMIFNRWGELIFESYNAAIGWDGTYGTGGLVQDGVYVWKINFKESMTDKKHEVYGHVSVLK
jgi:gliding motility-associated-like protein